MYILRIIPYIMVILNACTLHATMRYVNLQSTDYMYI